MERVITPKVQCKRPLPSEVTFEAFLKWADQDTRAEWLWKEPLPKVLDAAGELGMLGS